MMTREQYEAALAVVSKLVELDPLPESQEGCDLERISKAVEEYEREHFPLEPMCCRCCDGGPLFPAPCAHKPELTEGPIGMYHCPDCGAMVLAGMEHMPMCGPCVRGERAGYDTPYEGRDNGEVQGNGAGGEQRG